MPFLETNAMKRGEETVDTKFSALIEPNLFPDQIFQPNITFTDKYQTDGAGQIFVRKLGKGIVDRTTTNKFTHQQTADVLIPITLDEHFKQSEEIYEAVNVARTSGTGVQKFETLMSNVQSEWQTVAHTKLVAGATAFATTTATAQADVLNTIIDVRKQARDGSAMPDVIIASTTFFAKMLKQLSGKEYIPNTNDETLRTGSVGRIMGMKVYESNLLEDDGAAGSTEFVMYDHQAYSILTQVIAARIMDAGKDWVGSVAQAHLISGFKVTTPERVYKKVVAL